MTREPFIAHSELTNEIYIVTDKEKYRVTEQVIKAVMAIKALEQEPILDKIRAEIEQAADKQFQIAMGVSDLNERYAHIQMENAYRHSLNVIDKYRGESDCRECKAEYDCYNCKKYEESEV